ncbi:MAG: hypothetical protein K9N46_01275 [Candidatus Marinimicrobia bacterium]|nr:hypothetical protein [Candidatus Neomarinimicrobiota bacterium]MCF7827893.1 hypothetical protein [Candidatus Neomarinimicrobiota bacterium]MCF7879352.1 hypothetical protein [Candidatus Neomarinimicrobiota bacterium]
MNPQTTKRYDCVGIGLSPYDFTVQVERHPETNSKNVALRHHGQGGGPVPNAIAVLARLECRTALVTTMGDDIYAEQVYQELDSYGINLKGFRRDGKRRSLQAHIIVEQDSGNRTVILNSDDLPEIRPDQAPDSLLAETKLVVIDSRPSPGILTMAEEAKRHGAEVLMDAGSVQKHTEDALHLVDYPILSSRFVKDYFGHSNMERACREIREFGGTIAGITMGDEGSYLANEDAMLYFPAFDIEPVDTTGAGDVYHGGLMYGILSGWPLKAIGQFASAVAAICCMHLGVRRHLPDLEEIKEFMLEHGVEKHPVLQEQIDIFGNADTPDE